MPDYPAIAAHAFDEARAFYTGGLKRAAWVGASEEAPPGPGKSPNKMVLNEANKASTAVIGIHDAKELRDPTFEIRRAVASEGYGATSGADDVAGGIPIHYGRELVAKKVAGLNCGELAAIAAFRAWEKRGSPATVADIAVAKLADPADHGWCMVGPPAALAAVGGKSITDLKGFSHAAGDPWVVDAWTNLCLPIGGFHDAVREKAKRWMDGGKRISWGGLSGAAKGWYPPLGDYIAAFIAAKVSLQLGLDPET